MRLKDIIHVIPVIGLVLALSSSSMVGYAQEGEEVKALGKAIGAGLAVGLAGLGAGFAVGTAGAAGISGIVEKREVLGPILLIIILGEGIAIYGILIALLIILIL